MSLNPQSNLIAIIGGKGGVGKSVLSANLVTAITKELKQRSLLIDLDQNSCGDQNIITGLRPTKTLNDIVKGSAVINQKNLEQFLVPHASGFYYLGSSTGQAAQLNFSGSMLKSPIENLSSHFPYIVADLGSQIGDVQAAYLEMAHLVLVITTPEILVINQTRKILNELSGMALPGDMVQVVLNKVSKNGVSSQAIIQSLRKQVIAAIPQDDVTVFGSVQKSMPFVMSQPKAPITQSYHKLVRTLTGGMLQNLKSRVKKPLKKSSVQKNSIAVKSSGSANAAAENDVNTNNQLKLKIHSELIKEMDLKKDMTNTKGDSSKEAELRSKTTQTVSMLVDRMAGGMSRDERTQIIKEVIDEALGLGPLEALLSDKKVTEVMVNGHDQIYVERSGKLTLSPITFTSNLQLRNVIERIVTPLGRRIDEKTPYVDARLEDGSRVNAIIEPLAIDGPSVTIRKFPEERIVISDYVDRFHSLTQPMADFLKICVEQGLNVIISGGTGSGKTTLLNVMSGFIPENERIITVEDAAELQLKQNHVVRLETRPANMEGTGAVSIRDLIKNSLRMRPDRIIVGECRDGAALDMLSAMNTGHDGSMTTVHANTPREGISRLETLCMMAGMDLPAKAIREQVAGAVHLIVQIGRLSDGSRKIKSITEVVGMQGETVTLQEIFRFKEEGFDKNRKIIGQFQAMGLIPTFIEKFERRGIKIPRNLFMTTPSAPEKKPEAKTASKVTGISRPQVKKEGLKKPSLKRPATAIKKASGDK